MLHIPSWHDERWNLHQKLVLWKYMLPLSLSYLLQLEVFCVLFRGGWAMSMLEWILSACFAFFWKVIYTLWKECWEKWNAKRRWIDRWRKRARVKKKLLNSNRDSVGNSSMKTITFIECKHTGTQTHVNIVSRWLRFLYVDVNLRHVVG